MVETKTHHSLFLIPSKNRYLTTQGHMAGTKHDLDQAEHLRKTWLEQGLDQVFLQPYNVQLSKPDGDKPNKVRVQVKYTKITGN